MATLLLIAALIIAALPAQPAPLPYRLTIVESPGETLTPAQRDAARSGAMAALTWWASRGPGPFAPALVEERAIQVADPFSAGWLADALTLDSPTLEIYVVANHGSRGLLLGGRYAGYASPAHRAVVAVAHSVTGLAPTLTHELGHALYDLPDLYREPGACDRTDIMCWPGPAYRAGWVGCRSLAALGRPCSQVALPVVVTAP